MHKIKEKEVINMNNYIYPIPNNYLRIIMDELKKINETLNRIEKEMNEQTIKKEKKYLEKDDNYYMI